MHKNKCFQMQEILDNKTTLNLAIYVKDYFKIYLYPNSGTCITFDETNQLRVIAKKILREFWEKHRDCEQQLKSWYQEASSAEWMDTKIIKKEYPTASFLSSNRIVFNIKGNHYRLIVKINFDYKMVWIRFIGTHAEYDKIDATNI